MHKRILCLSIALPMALLAAGCNDRTDTNTVATNTGATTEISTDTSNGVENTTIATPTMTGQEFANTAASTDAYELAAAKLAKTKATDQKLKDFADMMIKDHTDSTAKLKEAAAKADPKITPDPAMTEEQKANIAALEGASGADFDAAYKSQQIMTHQKALAALEGYAAGGDVPSLRDFASTVRTVVQKHLDHIQGM